MKAILNDALQETIEPIRKRRKEFEQDKQYVYRVLFEGTERAEAIADSTLKNVKNAMSINYLDHYQLSNDMAS